MLCARFVVQSSVGNFSVQDLQYKVVLWLSSKRVLQECFRVLTESVLPECATRVWSKSVRQECLTRVCHKSIPQECPTRECHKSVTKDCPTPLSEKSIKQECSTGVAFNAIGHLLFAFHCSVGTFLLRELLKMHSGSWLLSGFLRLSKNVPCIIALHNHNNYTCLIVPGSCAKLTMLLYFLVQNSFFSFFPIPDYVPSGRSHLPRYVFQTICTTCWELYGWKKLIHGFDNCPVHGRSWKDWNRPMLWCHAARGGLGIGHFLCVLETKIEDCALQSLLSFVPKWSIDVNGRIVSSGQGFGLLKAQRCDVVGVFRSLVSIPEKTCESRWWHYVKVSFLHVVCGAEEHYDVTCCCFWNVDLVLFLHWSDLVPFFYIWGFY